MLAQIGLAAGAAGWKAGHIALRAGAVHPTRAYPARLPCVDEPTFDIEPAIEEYAASQARVYMRDVVMREELSPAQGVSVFATYMYAFINGVLDAAQTSDAP